MLQFDSPLRSAAAPPVVVSVQIQYFLGYRSAMLQALPGYPCGPEPKRVVQLEVSCFHDTDQSGWVCIIEGTLGTLDIICQECRVVWAPGLVSRLDWNR